MKKLILIAILTIPFLISSCVKVEDKRGNYPSGKKEYVVLKEFGSTNFEYSQGRVEGVEDFYYGIVIEDSGVKYHVSIIDINSILFSIESAIEPGTRVVIDWEKYSPRNIDYPIIGYIRGRDLGVLTKIE